MLESEYQRTQRQLRYRGQGFDKSDKDVIRTELRQIERWEVRLFHGWLHTIKFDGRKPDDETVTWVDVFDWHSPQVKVTPEGNFYVSRVDDKFLIDKDFDTLEEALEYYNNVEKHIFNALVTMT